MSKMQRASVIMTQQSALFIHFVFRLGLKPRDIHHDKISALWNPHPQIKLAGSKFSQKSVAVILQSVGFLNAKTVVGLNQIVETEFYTFL